MDLEKKAIEHVKHDIRHSLAIDRTKLANERTFLSYIRTSLTLIILGLSFLHFSESKGLKLISVIFIPGGIALFIYGAIWYYRRKRIIENDEKILNLK